MNENFKKTTNSFKLGRQHDEENDVGVLFTRAETNNRVFGIFVCYRTIRISGIVYQIFMRHTTLLAAAMNAILVGMSGCYYARTCVQVVFAQYGHYNNTVPPSALINQTI